MLGVPLSIQTSVIVGGMDVITQAREMNGRPHVVVATPGRLVDLLRSAGGEWGLDRVQTLVSSKTDWLLKEGRLGRWHWLWFGFLSLPLWFLIIVQFDHHARHQPNHVAILFDPFSLSLRLPLLNTTPSGSR